MVDFNDLTSLQNIFNRFCISTADIVMRKERTNLVDKFKKAHKEYTNHTNFKKYYHEEIKPLPLQKKGKQKE